MVRPTPPARDAETAHDLTRTLLGVLCVGTLIVAAFWIVRPFLAATIWAATFVIVLWPVLLRLQRGLGGNRALAIAVVTAFVLVLVAVPLVLALAVVITNADEIVARARLLAGARLAAPPDWIAGLPVVGPRLADAWQQFAAAGPDALWSRVWPYLGSLTRWLLVRAGNLGYVSVQFMLTLVLAAFMFANGEALAAAALRFGRRLGDDAGVRLVRLAGNAMRGVVLGVGLTAAVQSVLAGAGLAVAGVPHAGLLTALLFLLCIAQVGMLIALLPIVVWVFWQGEPLTGSLLLVWSLATGLLDQVLRPVLVSRSARLPALLIFVGVVGGIIAFGLLGIVVGPVVLAVGYTMLLAWLGDATATPADGQP